MSIERDPLEPTGPGADANGHVDLGSTAIRSAVEQAATALGASAASIFLFNRDRRRLQGALVGWDWTRSSFEIDLADWPSVDRAVTRNIACFITRADAERGGIDATLCAPIAIHGRVLGVLFFDYERTATSSHALETAKDVADDCGRLIDPATVQPAFLEHGAPLPRASAIPGEFASSLRERERDALRRAIGAMDASVAALLAQAHEPADAALPDAHAELGSTWHTLASLLTLEPEPERRACPFCGTRIMRLATRCLQCWRKSPPAARA